MIKELKKIIKMETKIEITQTNFRLAKEYLTEELKKLLTDGVVEIVTNGNIASCLQDSENYNLPETKITKNENGVANNYTLGKLYDINLVVNPYMRWYDNRILFKSIENTTPESHNENNIHIL